MKYYDKEYVDKLLSIWSELDSLVHSLNYHDQLKFFHDYKNDLDNLKLKTEIEAKLNLLGRKRLHDTIKLGNSVYASDPCYSVGTWCSAKLTNMLPGDYICFRTIQDTGDWGLRVSEILVIHKNYLVDDSSIDNLKYKYLNYDIGVDSGQCGIFDSEYYEIHHKQDILDESWYDKVCDITSDFAGTIDNLGFVSSSGYGDGSYDLYVVENSDNQIISIKIEFIS